VPYMPFQIFCTSARPRAGERRKSSQGNNSDDRRQPTGTPWNTHRVVTHFLHNLCVLKVLCVVRRSQVSRANPTRGIQGWPTPVGGAPPPGAAGCCNAALGPYTSRASMPQPRGYPARTRPRSEGWGGGASGRTEPAAAAMLLLLGQQRVPLVHDAQTRCAHVLLGDVVPSLLLLAAVRHSRLHLL
jgi:hypothetical protein